MKSVSRKTALSIFVRYLGAGGRAPYYSVKKLRPILVQYLEEALTGGLNPRYILPELLPDIRKAETTRGHHDPADIIRPPQAKGQNGAEEVEEFAEKVLNNCLVLTIKPSPVQLEMIFPPAVDSSIISTAVDDSDADEVLMEELIPDIW